MKQEHVSAEAYVGIQQEDSFLQGVKDCLPTVFGYLSIGFAAGVIEKNGWLKYYGNCAYVFVFVCGVRPVYCRRYAGSGRTDIGDYFNDIFR